MKIIAIIPPGPYEKPEYLVQVTTAEMPVLGSLGTHLFSIDVKDKDRAVKNRDWDKLQPGDVIDPSVAAEVARRVNEVLRGVEELTKGFSQCKGAMTRVQNVLAQANQQKAAPTQG